MYILVYVCHIVYTVYMCIGIGIDIVISIRCIYIYIDP